MRRDEKGGHNSGKIGPFGMMSGAPGQRQGGQRGQGRRGGEDGGKADGPPSPPKEPPDSSTATGVPERSLARLTAGRHPLREGNP